MFSNWSLKLGISKLSVISYSECHKVLLVNKHLLIEMEVVNDRIHIEVVRAADFVSLYCCCRKARRLCRISTRPE